MADDCGCGGGGSGFQITTIEYPQNPFHPEEMRNMTYRIGQMYTIGDGYMIGGPQYSIGAPMSAMMLHPNANANASVFQQQALARQGMVAPAAFIPQNSFNVPQMIPQNPYAVQLMPTPTIVHKSDPTESRLQPLGCNYTTDIAVGGTATASVSPQRVFKAERYIVPDTVAPDFNINSIFIGVELQSPAAGAIAAESFLPNSIYSNVDFTTCQISQTISVQVANKGGAARPFYSTFYGRTLQ